MSLLEIVRSVLVAESDFEEESRQAQRWREMPVNRVEQLRDKEYDEAVVYIESQKANYGQRLKDLTALRTWAPDKEVQPKHEAVKKALIELIDEKIDKMRARIDNSTIGPKRSVEEFRSENIDRHERWAKNQSDEARSMSKYVLGEMAKEAWADFLGGM